MSTSAAVPKTVRLAIRVRATNDQSLRFEGTFPINMSLWEMIATITPVGSAVPLNKYETPSKGWYLPVLKYKTLTFDTIEALTTTSVRQLNITGGSALLEASLVPSGITVSEAFAKAESLRAAYLDRQARVMSELNNRSPNTQLSPSSPIPVTSSSAAADGSSFEQGRNLSRSPNGGTNAPSNGAVRLVHLRPFRHAIAAVPTTLELLLDEILIRHAATARPLPRTSFAASDGDSVATPAEIGDTALQVYKSVLAELRKFLINLLNTNRLVMTIPDGYAPTALDPPGDPASSRIFMHPTRARARSILLSRGCDESKVSISEVSPASTVLSRWDHALRLLCLCGFALVDEHRSGSEPVTSGELTALPHPSGLLFVSSPGDALTASDSIASILVHRGGHFAVQLTAGPGNVSGSALLPHPMPPSNTEDQELAAALAEDAQTSRRYSQATRLVLVPELEDTELITRALQEIEEAEIRFPPMSAEAAGRRAVQLLRKHVEVQQALRQLHDRFNELLRTGMEFENALAVLESDERVVRSQQLQRLRQAESDDSASMDYDINQLKAALERVRHQTQTAEGENPLTRPILCATLTSLVNMTQQVLNKLAAREAVRVDTSKPTFQAKLGRFPATLEVMQFLGFSSAIDNPLVQTCTPTESDRLRISRAQAIIQAAFQQATPNASESAYAEFLASQEGAARVARGWDPIVYEPREVRVGGSTVEEPRASSGRLNALASRFGNSARAMDEDSYSASDTALIMSVLGGRLNQEQSLITSEGRFLTKAEAEQLEQAKAKVYDSTIFRIEFADQHRVQLTFPPSAPFETVFDALDKILNPNVVARDYCLRIGPKLLTRTRGIVDLTKSSSQWPPERVARSPYLSFTDARLVPAVHARIQWLDQDMETPSSHTEVKRDVDGLSASTCLRPEVFARRVPYQEVSVPKPLGSSDNTSSVQASAGTQTAAAPREAARSTTELSDADLDRLTEQMLSGNRGRVGGTSGTKPGNKVPAWFAKK